MRDKDKIKAMLDKIDEIVDADDGFSHNDVLIAVQSTLIWVLHENADDSRITDYFPL